jgi:hypothetical protein
MTQILHKINRLHTPEECRKLIEQSDRKGGFQQPCATIVAQGIDEGSRSFANSVVPFQSYGKAVHRAQKVLFCFTVVHVCIQLAKIEEVITADLIDGFVKSSCRLLSVSNEIHDVPRGKAFPIGKNTLK